MYWLVKNPEIRIFPDIFTLEARFVLDSRIYKRPQKALTNYTKKYGVYNFGRYIVKGLMFMVVNY